MWRITNLGTTSRKEHKYSSCRWTSKRREKKSVVPLTTVCVGVVFHRNFSSAGGINQLILPATLRQTSQTSLPTAWHYVARHDDFYCLSSADGTRIEGHTTSLLVETYGCTLRFTARPWYVADFLHILHFAENAVCVCVYKPQSGTKFMCINWVSLRICVHKRNRHKRYFF
jgi:hypothetical protein